MRPRSHHFKDLSGQKFHHLLVLRYFDNNAPNRRVSRFLCRCDCGVEKVIQAGRLGILKSCGCKTNDYIRTEHKTHGDTSGGKTKEYRAWKAIKDRCFLRSAKSFPRYGGRGITMCSVWRESFEAFLADIGRAPSPDHSVDRINNAGGYEPGNVRWATRAEQCRNRCQNVWIEFQGRRQCLKDWCDELGIAFYTASRKNIAGWDFDRIVDYCRSHPPKPRAKRA